MMSTMFSRFGRTAGVLVLLSSLAVGAAGCDSLPFGSTASKIDSLTNVPEAVRADFKTRIEQAASGDEKKKLVMQVEKLNDIVGKTLVNYVYVPDSTGKMMLKEDGTVALSKEFAPYMSNATHWRLGEDTYDLCTSKECEYYSSWRVEAGPKGEDYRFVLVTNGNEDNPIEVVRIFAAL